MKRTVELLVDSGAFSAWTIGAKIDIKEYITWLKEWKPYLWGYINLDTIPGSPGQKRTGDQVEKAAVDSYKNLQKIKDAGLNPIPVFHRGEKLSHLERLLKDGETYIGLSPLVDSGEEEKEEWLDKIFTYLTDKQGRPLVKTHGFGVTSFGLMNRYPWYSVDSTSWVKTGGFGIMLVPPEDTDGNFDYSFPPIRVHSSEVETKVSPASYDCLGPNEQRTVDRWFKEQGLTLAELKHSRYSRCKMVLKFYNDYAAQPRKPFSARRPMAFLPRLNIPKTLHPIDAERLFLFQSTNLSGDQASLLTHGKSFYRLLNYLDLKKAPPERVREYVIDGMELTYTRKQPPMMWNNRRYTSWRRVKLIERHEEYKNAALANKLD